jgi:diacylglycerol kinase
MGKPGASGPSQFWCAPGLSLAGLKAAYENEAVFRQKMGIAAVLIPAAFFAREYD